MTVRDLIALLETYCDRDDKVGVEVLESDGTGIDTEIAELIEVRRDPTSGVRCVLTTEDSLGIIKRVDTKR